MALPSISRWEGRVALVTGASVGIGAAICKSLVQHKMIVIGCARNQGQIDDVAAECTKLGYKGKLHSYKCDLTQEAEIEAMFKWIEANHGGVDVCINNAGFSSGEGVLGCTVKKTRDMLDTNIVALMLCARKTVESMNGRKVDDGHIININSILGHKVIPMDASHVYGSTKWAVTALTEALRQELRAKKSRIRVTGICPGVVDTEFADRALGPGSRERMKAMIPAIEAQDVADTVVYALSAPPTVEVQEILVAAAY